MSNDEEENLDSVIMNSQITDYRAMKSFLETEKKLDMMQNRVKILKLNEQSYLSRATTEKKKHEVLASIHKEQAGKNDKYNQMKTRNQESVDKFRERVQAERRENQAKMKQIKQEIHQQKNKDRQEICERSIQIDKQVRKGKENSIHEKQKKKEQVAIQLQASRMRYIKYHDSKRKAIEQRKERQIQELNHKRILREKQLQEIEDSEAKLHEKQLESRVVFRNLRKELEPIAPKSARKSKKAINSEEKAQGQ